MNKEEIAFGIDIGGTNTKMGIFNHEGKLLSYRTLPTPHQTDPKLFIKELARESDHMLNTELGINLGDSSIVGLGAGAPMANYFTGAVEHAPNLGWKNVPLRKLFEDNFKVTSVIENDANLAAVGESRWGAGKKLTDFVLVTLGTGVGTGLILDNKLYRGNLALGAEGGHMIIPHYGERLCSCGGMNHLESYLSAKGIKQTIHELTGEEWTIENLGKLFSEGNLKATTLINTIAAEFAIGLTSMAVLFGPQAFVIGGGVSKLGKAFNHVVEQKLNEFVHFSLKGKIKVITASLSTEKGAVYGGAALIFEELGK